MIKSENLQSDGAPISPLAHFAAAAIYLALALAATFPLWLDPAGRIQSLGDPLLNAYILDWVHWALLHYRRTFGFFNATALWPHTESLAYGEHLIVPALMALPARAFTGSAVALHNLSVAQGYFFCALAAHALAFHYFRRALPALVGGLAYGFAAYRLSQSGHIQLLHGEFLPLMALAFEKALNARSRKWAVALGLAALGQWLTSWYWAVFSFGALGPYFAARLWHRRGDLGAARVVLVAAPLIGAALLTLQVAEPYARLKANGFFFRPPEASAGLSARPTDFLSPPRQSLLYGKLLGLGAARADAGESERRLFPGLVAGAAMAAGAWLALRRHRDRASRFPARLWLAISLILVVFSFGSRVKLGDGKEEAATTIPLPYALVERVMPFADSMRAAARWTLPALLGGAMLAAFAADSLARRMKGGALASGLAPGLAALLAVESIAAPASFVEVPKEPPPVYAHLGKRPASCAIFELPLLPLDNNMHLLHATWHRQFFVNGTNGFMPPGHVGLWRQLALFPEGRSLDELEGTAVSYIVIDTTALSGTMSEPWPAARVLDLQKRFGARFGIEAFGDRYLIDLQGGGAGSDGLEIDMRR